MLLPTNDWRVSHDFVDFLPTTYLFKLLAQKDKELQFYVNAINYASAHGWNRLNNAFGGSGEYSQFLPFKLEDDSTGSSGLSPLTDRTITVLKSLLAKNKIPRAVLSELSASGIFRLLIES